MSPCDLLLAHAYHLHLDPVEANIMRPHPPLGLLSLSAWLKQKGVSLQVFDSTFAHPSDFAEQLRRFRPRVVGLYVNMMTRRNALSMMRQAKHHGSWVVLGGPEPPAHAEEFLLRGADIIVVGEGERTLEALLEHLRIHGMVGLERIAGLIFRDLSGRLVHTPPRAPIKPLKTLPWPDREAIDLGPYLHAWRSHHGYGSISLITARGCPFTCTWCSHAVYGHSHRRRPPEDVVAEIQHIQQTYAPERLWIADDVFTISQPWLKRWAGLMADRGLRLPYDCITRADCLTEASVRLLAETGCTRVWFGSESGAPTILEAMDRGVSPAQIRQAVAWCRDFGVESGLFIMLGYDGETRADVERTIAHLKATAPDAFLTTVAYPIKGTRFDRHLGDRIIRPSSWEETTDRDVRFRGRPSDRYHRFAVMRVVESLTYHRQQAERPLSLSTARAFLKSHMAGVGMRLTEHLGGY